MSAPLPSVAYAKNPEHERFIQSFEGQVKGRYHLAFLVGIEYIGGHDLRARIEKELANPHYQPDDWYSARDMVVMFDRAVRAGLAVGRVGELVMPTYKRSNPKAFEGKTIIHGFEILEQAYRAHTSYGGVSPPHEVEPRCVRLYRLSPLPCEYFVGVVKGLLSVFGIQGTSREVTCQWEGGVRCCFEARWEDAPIP